MRRVERLWRVARGTVRAELDTLIGETTEEGGAHSAEESADALGEPDDRDGRDERRVPGLLALCEEEARHARPCEIEWIRERDGGAARHGAADRAGPEVAEVQR